MHRTSKISINDRRKIRWISWLLIFLFICCLFFAAISTDIKTVCYTVRSEKIKSPVKICVVSDLHSCIHGDNQIKLIEAIRSGNPDLIAFTGDICDDHVPNIGTELLLDAIASDYPCYYVSGNHEFWTGNMEGLREMFRSYGVTILRGDCGTIEIKGNNINICGIDDPDCYYYEPNGIPYKKQMSMLENAADNGYFTIFLAHRPERIKQYLDFPFDLILSGHAHGGQWRIPGLVNGVFAPNQGAFPKYAGGQYSFGDTEFIVSRGLSLKNIRKLPRIFNPPELVFITLER